MARLVELDYWKELSSMYSETEIWKINEKFLDIQISSGREIILSHNPLDFLGDTSFYGKEVRFLVENGFKQIGELWYAIR